MATVLTTEAERVMNITSAFTKRRVHSVTYYGITFLSLEAFLQYRKDKNIKDNIIS